jgi:hypothetical protein
MTVSVFIGTSVDGFIARPNGDLDFLPEGGGEPHGYDEFIAGLDALVIAILSVVVSCRRLKLPVRGYLASVLPGLADRPVQCLPELTPAAWGRLAPQHSASCIRTHELMARCGSTTIRSGV